VETARTARTQLFGARRGSNAGDPANSPPDLSALRAQPDEIDAEALSEAAEVEDQTPAIDVEPPSTPPIPAEIPRAVEAPKPIERPSLFNRQPRVKPAEPAPAPAVERQVEAAPVSRRAAPPREQVTVAPAEPRSRAPLDEEQFSPRAIMTRERRTEPEIAAPRRERPRIAARAIAAPASPAANAPAMAADHTLLEEAIGLIITRATELDQEIDLEAKVPVDLILDHARETTELVIGVVSRGRTDDLRRINSDLGEVLDVIMLMQLEKGHAPADDALTLLLQLRRELETLRAA
jgi:hypothetical protein